jgi:alkanesulfonate monooxygenase SsuD/methylene tetrahydromethanopterin reductase-like flavin-dependent oxidoreductase (luciferase family)
MRVGLALPQLGLHADARAVRGFAERAEELGFGHLFVQQHLFYPHEVVSGYSARPGLAVPEAYRSVLQPLELLSVVAGWTSEIILGTSILVAGYHRPVDLAQRIAQYDVDPRTRGRRAGELIDALKACWGPDPVSFDGEFFAIPASDVDPKPVQRPHPPLMSGMRSEVGLKRTAEQFDWWNPASGTLEQHLETMQQLAAMRPAGLAPLRMCWNLFTDPPVIVANLRPLTVDELCEQVAAAAAAGVDAVSVEANFDPSITSPEDWVAVPDRLAPLLEAAVR